MHYGRCTIVEKPVTVFIRLDAAPLFSLRIQEQRLFEDAVYCEIIFLKSLPVIDHLRWRHFTTTTRIFQGFAFVCKLRLLLFKPHWDYQIKI